MALSLNSPTTPSKAAKPPKPIPFAKLLFISSAVLMQRAGRATQAGGGTGAGPGAEKTGLVV